MCIFCRIFVLQLNLQYSLHTESAIYSSWKAGMDAFSVLDHQFLDRLLHSVIIDWLLESIIDLGLHFLSFIVLWVS